MAQARDDIARSPWVEQGAIETHRYEGGLVGSVRIPLHKGAHWPVLRSRRRAPPPAGP